MKCCGSGLTYKERLKNYSSHAIKFTCLISDAYVKGGLTSAFW